MDDVWFGRGATEADYADCLRAMPVDRTEVALLAIAATGPASRLIFAGRALFDVFGAASGEDLEAQLLHGWDPGARRLGAIVQTLPVDAAPRLERLRFNIGPGTRSLTLLCRRISTAKADLFVAAVLGLPARSSAPLAQAGAPLAAPGLGAAIGAPETRAPVDPPRRAAGPMNIQAIQAMLKSRWPAGRTLRFTWQTDANMICTQITATLADIVGGPNADLVGRDMSGIANLIDPTGRFAKALADKQTWSGLQVHWPIADTPAAVAVSLGAIPMFERDSGFDGFRGYGVVDRESAIVAAPVLLTTPADPKETAINLVPFPGGRTELSAEDHETFVALGEELREEVGFDEPVEGPSAEPVADPPPVGDRRQEDLARHGLAILDKLAVGVLVSRDNVPIFANRHLLDGLGFRTEDEFHAAGGLAYLFNDTPDDPAGDKAVRLSDPEGQSFSNRARVQTIDWDGLPATLVTLSPMSEGGEAAKIEAAKRRQEVELHDLRAILETATDGVAVIDERFDILSLNRSGEALFGCDRSKMIGHPFLSLFAADNQDLVRTYLEGLTSNATQRLLNDGRELVVNARQGGTIPVFMTLGRLPGTPSTAEKGGTRFCALFRDLTHWKKVESDLESAKLDAESANDRKSDFLAKVSHEVRTPLNAIIGFAEVMMDERLGPVGSERYKEYLRDIHTSGTHVLSLVNDLLDLSKIEAGKLDLALEDIDLNKIIGECVAIMQPQASGSRVIVRMSLSPTLPRIRADERSLRQIVLNILSNAVKFNEPGGQVIVATTMTEAGHAVIRIRDTGPGMSEMDITAALEPFRQLPTSRPLLGGTGLGLPLTKALVEANQATFTIRSKLQQGTLVEVAFPPARVLAA